MGGGTIAAKDSMPEVTLGALITNALIVFAETYRRVFCKTNTLEVWIQIQNRNQLLHIWNEPVVLK